MDWKLDDSVNAVPRLSLAAMFARSVAGRSASVILNRGSHRGSDSDARLFEMLTGHCPDLLSGMNTLLERGKPVRIGHRVGADA